MSEHSVSINYDRENNLAVATGGICVAVAFVLSLITVLAVSLSGGAGVLAAPRAERIRIRSITGKLSLVSFRRMIIGVVAGIALRMICHVLSGVIFFAEYAGEQNPWVYSIVYNGSYLLPEAIITLAVLLSVMFSFRLRSIKQ